MGHKATQCSTLQALLLPMNHWLAFLAICVSGSLLSARILMRALTFHFDPMSESLAGVEGKQGAG